MERVHTSHVHQAGDGLTTDDILVPELISFSLSIIAFSLSRTIVEVVHVDAGEHMVPGPFHVVTRPIQAAL
jgi:hypothetical protein